MVNEPKQILEYLRNLQATLDVLSWIASRFDKAVDTIEQQQSTNDVLRNLSEYLSSIDDVLRELSEYLSGIDRIDRIDRMLLLILEKLPADNVSPRVKRETDYLLQETLKSRITSLQTQIDQHQKNQNWAEEQASLYGPAVTLDIKNKINWEREKIANLKAELEYTKGQLKS